MRSLPRPIIIALLTCIVTVILVNFSSVTYGRELLYLKINIVSVSLILLTIFLTVIIIQAQFFVNYRISLQKMFILLLFRLIFTFSTSSLIIFYFYFEWSLIPIFLIVIGWGYQPERLLARMALFFYTIFASLPLLVIILNRYIEINRFEFTISSIVDPNVFSTWSTFMYIFFTGAFLVKFPMFMVHMWLPKAHVEAPVSGSIILAGVLLKLGGYGLRRVSIFLDKPWIQIVLFSLILLGGGLLGVLCLAQSDIKVVIAYSSVVHISLVIIGFLSLLPIGGEGGIMIMIAHGFCSSAIFAGANIIYERSHSRRYLINTGFLMYYPFFRILWFILIVANFGGPFTYNLLGEILLILNIRYINLSLMVCICLLSLFSAGYSLILYRRTQQGQAGNICNLFSSFTAREYVLLVMHIWVLVILPLNSIIT